MGTASTERPEQRPIVRRPPSVVHAVAFQLVPQRLARPVTIPILVAVFDRFQVDSHIPDTIEVEPSQTILGGAAKVRNQAAFGERNLDRIEDVAGLVDIRQELSEAGDDSSHRREKPKMYASIR